MHYKKASWRDVVDPAFDSFVKLYLWGLRETNLPSNEGFLALALDEKQLEKMEAEHFPGIAFLYEKRNVGDDFIRKVCREVGFDLRKADLDVIAGGMGSLGGLYDLLLSSAKSFDGKSKEYYVKAFDSLSSEKKFRKFVLVSDEKGGLKVKRKFESDVVSWLMHCFKLFFDEMMREAKTENMRKLLRREILGCHSLVRMSIFNSWDRVSLLVHKKSLCDLYGQAKAGSDESLFKLLQIDKTIFDHGWVRTRIRKAAYTGEWEFFHSLSESVKRDPLANRRIHGDVLMVLLTLWKVGLYRLTVPQLMELLKDSGLRLKYDEVNFRRFVNREIKPQFKNW